ncbi:hypothetical protein ABZ092_00730 [Streptomyces bobili]|uniref:hypothetical protein n=1 Tax=Streptomyces bobili TaxID=67280 RepID=UPI0033A88934
MTHELNRGGFVGTAASVAGATAPAPVVPARGGGGGLGDERGPGRRADHEVHGQVARAGHVPCADPPGTAGFAAQNKAAIGPRPRPLPGLPRSSGRSVPEDASVRAMRPDQLAEQRAPALTTASGQTRELGPAGACAALFGPTDTHHGRRHSP